ncbi:MAG: universal stress protein [Calditrichaeota bacterium]|nr:universal stress protein [Calditrichota bacterium]RQV99090.1 MAG: universal stress protein [Calditrichota bacterium]
MIKSILLAVDGSAYTDSVLKYGISLSKKFDAMLRVLTVIDIRIFEWAVAIGVEGFAPIIPSSGYQEESQKILEQKADEVLKKTEKILQKEDVHFVLEKESGNPVDVICDKARLSDLLVMGARGEFAKWSDKMLGATVEALTRLCIKPVLVSPRDYMDMKKMLIAYDGSENASKALTLAAFFASKLSLSLLLLNVNESEESGKNTLKEAREYLAPYNFKQVEERIIKGEPSEKIIEVAEESGSDLLVMGSYGHSRIREAILGSTTVQTMRKARIPVLIGR